MSSRSFFKRRRSRDEDGESVNSSLISVQEVGNWVEFAIGLISFVVRSVVFFAPFILACIVDMFTIFHFLLGSRTWGLLVHGESPTLEEIKPGGKYKRYRVWVGDLVLNIYNLIFTLLVIILSIVIIPAAVLVDLVSLNRAKTAKNVGQKLADVVTGFQIWMNRVSHKPERLYWTQNLMRCLGKTVDQCVDFFVAVFSSQIRFFFLIVPFIIFVFVDMFTFFHFFLACKTLCFMLEGEFPKLPQLMRPHGKYKFYRIWVGDLVLNIYNTLFTLLIIVFALIILPGAVVVDLVTFNKTQSARKVGDKLSDVIAGAQEWMNRVSHKPERIYWTSNLMKLIGATVDQCVDYFVGLVSSQVRVVILFAPFIVACIIDMVTIFHHLLGCRIYSLMMCGEWPTIKQLMPGGEYDKYRVWTGSLVLNSYNILIGLSIIFISAAVIPVAVILDVFTLNRCAFGQKIGEFLGDAYTGAQSWMNKRSHKPERVYWTADVWRVFVNDINGRLTNASKRNLRVEQEPGCSRKNIDTKGYGIAIFILLLGLANLVIPFDGNLELSVIDINAIFDGGDVILYEIPFYVLLGANIVALAACLFWQWNKKDVAGIMHTLATVAFAVGTGMLFGGLNGVRFGIGLGLHILVILLCLGNALFSYVKRGKEIRLFAPGSPQERTERTLSRKASRARRKKKKQSTSKSTEESLPPSVTVDVLDEQEVKAEV